MREEKIIFLKDVDAVNDFVAEAEKYDFPIMARMKHMKINAKSFMGMLSQAIGQNVKIVYTERCDAFEESVKQFLVYTK